MVQTNATKPTITPLTASSTLHHQPSTGAPENLNYFALGNKHFSNSEAEHSTASSKALQTNPDNFRGLVRTVHFKPCTDRESQIDEHVHKKQNATAQLKKRLSNEFAISTQFDTYKKPFTDFILQFYFIWDVRLRRISIGKLSIKLIQLEKEAENSTRYRAGSEIQEFGKAEIDKIFSRNIIKPAQTNWTAPIVFVPN